MQITQVPIDQLRPAEYNPRAWSEKDMEDLKRSIQEFGVVDPIIANSAENRKGVIIGGHFRWHVLKELGWKEAPVVWVEIADEERERRLNLRLNKNLGRWDFDMLANFDEQLLLDVGFSQNDLDEIFGLEKDEEFDVEKEVKRVQAQAERRCHEGDLWRLGDHRLVVGDCTKRENWERVMDEEQFDFMFTDPPYKLRYAKTFKDKVRTKKGFGYRQQRTYLGVERGGGVPEYDAWLSLASEFRNPKGSNVMVFECWRNTPEIWAAVEKYWKIRNMVIWWLPNRHQGFSLPGQFFNKYDIAMLGDEGNAPLNEVEEKELEVYLMEYGEKLLNTYEVALYGNEGNAEWFGRKGRENSPYQRVKGSRFAKISDHISWTDASETESGQNVVFGTKPLQILVPYIKILSPRDGIVAEPFAGSGSTLLACEIMKRKCRAIEIEPIYAEVILARWEKLTGQQAEKIA